MAFTLFRKGFQKWIGYNGVKSAPVYFHARRTEKFNTTGLINFTSILLNVGNAMDGASGIFTAPRSGIYFFSFTGHVLFPASDRVSSEILFARNGGEFERTSITETNTGADHWSVLTLQATQNLISGDTVGLILSSISPGAYLNGDSIVSRTFFTGFLLEEEIVASL
jgi:hypothetical protein